MKAIHIIGGDGAICFDPTFEERKTTEVDERNDKPFTYPRFLETGRREVVA